MEENEVQKSKYNSAVAKEIRRSELWKDANRHSRSGLYKKWNEDLDSIWRELCADLIKKGKDFIDKDGIEKFNKYKAEFEKFNNELSEVGEFLDVLSDDFQNPSKEKISNRNKHYKILCKKEIFIRMLENYLGKGTKEDEDDEDGFG